MKFRFMALMACFKLLLADAHAATFNVTTTEDKLDFSQCTPQLPNHCSLRTAIIWSNQIKGQDEIVIPAGTYKLTRSGIENFGTINATINDLDITDSVILQGAGAEKTILDGNNQHRVLDIHDAPTSQHVVLRDLSIRHAFIPKNNQPYAYSNGAAIRAFHDDNDQDNEWAESDKDRLDIVDCEFSDNMLYPGGAGMGPVLFFDGDQLHVENTTFQRNKMSGPWNSGTNVNVAEIFRASSVIFDRVRIVNNGEVVNVGDEFLHDIRVRFGVKFFALLNSEMSGNVSSSSLFFDGWHDDNWIVNTTISGNAGSAIQHHGGALGLLHVTVAGNNYQNISQWNHFNGDGSIQIAGELWAKNSLFATQAHGPSCVVSNGSMKSYGNNLDASGTCQGLDLQQDLIGIDPLLGGLAFNGGPTRTHAIKKNSAARDAAEAIDWLTQDQRGFKRSIGSAPDIGAYEFMVITPCWGSVCPDPHD